MSEVANAMSQWAEKNMEDIEQEWSKSRIDGNAEIQFDIVADELHRVIGEYKAKGQKMWINEYGSGSLMDTDNPDLPKYKQSRYWNTERENNEIRTRQGEYLDLDGNTQIGSGIGGTHGLNAEKMYRDKNGITKNQYNIAQPPMHTIKETLLGNTAHNVMFRQQLLKAFGASINDEIMKVVHK